MVVLVESRVVQFDDSLPSQLLSSPSLQQSAHAFKSAGICTLSDGNAADNAANLIVLQREGGSAWPGQFAFVGSEDATTCHIIFIQSRAQPRTIAVAHVDCDEADQQLEILMQLFSNSSNQLPAASDLLFPVEPVASDCTDGADYDVHLVGGYADEENSSIAVTLSVLRFLCAHRSKFALKLFFVGAANTVAHPSLGPEVPHPWTRGALMCTRTSTVFAFESLPSSQNAGRVVRSMLHYTEPARLLHHVCAAEKGAQLILGPYPISVPRQMTVLARLPDDVILQRCSSSPSTENSRFASELRELYSTMVQISTGEKTSPFPLNGRAVRRIKRVAINTHPSLPTASAVIASVQDYAPLIAGDGNWKWFNDLNDEVLNW